MQATVTKKDLIEVTKYWGNRSKVQAHTTHTLRECLSLLDDGVEYDADTLLDKILDTCAAVLVTGPEPLIAGYEAGIRMKKADGPAGRKEAARSVLKEHDFLKKYTGWYQLKILAFERDHDRSEKTKESMLKYCHEQFERAVAEMKKQRAKEENER